MCGHQQQRELAGILWRVWGFGDQSLEHLSWADERTLELGCDRGVGVRRRCERTQPPTVVGVELDEAGDHRRDQVFRGTAQDLVEERILGIGQQFGCHLGQRVEVAIEDRASKAGSRHNVTHSQRCERAVEQQLTRGVEDPTPSFI